MTHIFYCAWLKTQVETCVTGTFKAQVETRVNSCLQGGHRPWQQINWCQIKQS